MSGFSSVAAAAATVTSIPQGASTVSIGRAQIAVTGTAVQISTSSVACRSVVVTALPVNVLQMFVGDSSVNRTTGSENGLVLQPNEKVGIDVANVNELYINGQAGDVVTYLAIN